MNVLLLTNEDGLAGSSFSVSYLAKGLSERGLGVVLGCRQGSLLWDLLAGSPVERLHSAPRGIADLAAMRLIAETVGRRDIAVIDSQSSRDRYLSMFSRALFRLPAAVIHTRRQMPRSDGGFLQGRLYTWGTERIVAVSEGVKQGLVRLGIPEGHIAVIHNGTPREKYEGLDHGLVGQLATRYGLRQGDRVIGCVARRKQQEQLLAALRLVDTPCTVLFVGIDADAQLSALAAALQDRHRVIFCGSVTPHEALHHYPLMSVSVLPSDMEGLSQSLLEAMALGVPVIATSAGGNPELIRDGVNGFLFGDGDVELLTKHIVTMLDGGRGLDAIVAAARRTALEEFSVDRTIDSHLSLFAEVVAERRTRLSSRAMA